MEWKISKYQLFLITLFLAFWVWAAINPKYPDGWLLENYLVFIFVPIILIVSYYFKLSNTSYTLITAFMIMHVIGSHYTYAEVPLGYTLQEWFGSSRNMYDRIVHFSFGFLLAYPIREVFVRLGKTKGLWGLYFPIELTLGLAAIYEIIEWGAAVIVDPTAGLAFLGAQGDVWDAQKDMALAGIGSVIAMIVVAGLHLVYNKNFKKEIKESLRVEKGDKPLGEIKIKEWMTQRSQVKKKE
ncbi:MAG: DUF2238 domain-containing protein [Nanoarchaeota archaeon]